jgi:hypothetical protein
LGLALDCTLQIIMVRPLSAFVCLFILLPVTISFAENQVRDGDKEMAGPDQVAAVSFDKRFAFSPYPDEQGRTVNFFLQKIAEGSGRLRVYTEYAFSGEILALLLPVDGRRGYELVLQLVNPVLSGELVYRDFSLEKVLVPDRVSLKVNVSKPDGLPVFQEIVMEMDIPPRGEVLYRKFLPPDRIQLGWPVDITDIDFSYSDAVHGRFHEWLSVLESYYDAGRELERIPDMLNRLSYTDPEKIILGEFDLCEAEQVIARAHYAPFHEWFGPDENDPAGVFSMLGTYGRQTALLRQKFNQAITRIDTLFYQKALAAMGEGDHGKGRELLLSALVYNPFHLGAHHALAQMDHGSGDLPGALSRLGRVISKMYPAGLWKDRMHELSEQVMESIFEVGSEFMRDGRFLDALRVLGSVEEFCDAVNDRYVCPPRLHRLQSLSHQGMFQSFITVSERALANDNLVFCVTYLRSALDYQQDHPTFIPDARDAQQILQKVVNRHISKGATLWLEGNLTGAREHFQAAGSLCDEFEYLECGSFPSQL